MSGRQGRSAGSGAARNRRRGHGPARLDGQAPRAKVAGESDEGRERRSAASGPGDAPISTPRGERPCVPKARLAGGIQSAQRAIGTRRRPIRRSLFGRLPKRQVQRGGVGRRPTLLVRHARSAHDKEKQKEGRSPRCLHEPPLGHRQDRVARHDQVIQHAHVDQRHRRFQRLRQQLVRPRRLRRTTRMVVHEQQRA